MLAIFFFPRSPTNFSLGFVAPCIRVSLFSLCYFAFLGPLGFAIVVGRRFVLFQRFLTFRSFTAIFRFYNLYVNKAKKIFKSWTRKSSERKIGFSMVPASVLNFLNLLYCCVKHSKVRSTSWIEREKYIFLFDDVNRLKRNDQTTDFYAFLRDCGIFRSCEHGIRIKYRETYETSKAE